MNRTHVPVLAAELIELTAPAVGETAVDCTFGGGGHASLMAGRIGADGTLVCVDRDPSAEERYDALAREVQCETRFIRADFADALEGLVADGSRSDIVYLDLGVSSMQIDQWERGFSYSYEAPLDMRMDPTQDLDAREVVNDWDERRIARILREYGEERFADRIAKAIARRRRKTRIETTQELSETIYDAVPAPARFAGGHPSKRSFQAIRIAVNDELGALERALPAAWALLPEGGRLAAISFHSLEDRMVKRFMTGRATGCICPPDLPVCACGREPEALLLTRRAVMASAGEIADNPRSKSSRLRVAVKLGAGS